LTHTSVILRASAWRDVHVDDRESPGGVISEDGDGVGVAYQTNVPQALVLVDLRDRQIAFEIIRRHCGDSDVFSTMSCSSERDFNS